MDSAPLLEMRGITKEFPGVRALDNVNFKVKRGQIHGLVGENGAGKSTLMKVLSGVYPYGSYSGDILFDGDVQQFRTISNSEEVGIAIIYQELALVPDMTVYENIFLGHEITGRGLVDWNETIRRSKEMLEIVHLDINPSVMVRELSVSQQQLVEIAKALSKNVKLLILDEPTSALNENESENLLGLIGSLKDRGITSVLISHKLKEVIKVSDEVTVLRDGQTVGTLYANKGEVDENTIIKNMVGREINNIYPPRNHTVGNEVVFEVRNLNAYDRSLGRQILQDVNFKLHRGEIVGFAGLMGSGRTELALSVFGNPRNYQISGEIIKNGEKRDFRHPSQAIQAGLAYVSEDRKSQGLILIQDIRQNITLANLRELANRTVVDRNKEIQVSREYKDSLDIKTPSIEQTVVNLSGGNQQKVSLAKWLFVKPDILILDEPTRGIDVGAKLEIYTIMNDLVEQGMSIIMISSELPEVLGMSDRIYVMSEGRFTGELQIEDASQEAIMRLATT
ncbi:ATP-binding cassette domain-containing protein [Phototrophicus methaneseepsis]|uniref:ATP-binding cassette domain-containing protein n=2 Tax=Phototrophicus methaneseepsis TaxID=2710758 RepID=A0A7S8EDU3_9CHLR|nr:ATP-binding cassette domain-containing protein [Phototrophicus methaneseepsis]